MSTANTPAARDVLAERRRQIEGKGWTPEHDDEHVNDEIAALACYYAMPPAARDWDATSTSYGHTLGTAILPADWWPPDDQERRQELVKAGALILAEIERLDRAEGIPSPLIISTASVLTGQLMVMAKLLQAATAVARTVTGDTAEGDEMLQDLIDQSEAAIATVLTEHAMGKPT